jgi:hypothetical protein
MHTIVLDRMCIRHHKHDPEADESVTSLCANITSLDIGGNLFESWDEILNICRLFPSLTSLTLDGNRLQNLESLDPALHFPKIKYLALSDTLLKPDEITTITSSFPSLQTLILANNQLSSWATTKTSNLPPTLHSLDLSTNKIPTLTSLTPLLTLPTLHTLLLKSNLIASSPESPTTLSRTLQTLDLRSNLIASWLLPTALPLLFPSLTNLLLSSNPLYTALTAQDASTLTLARLPLLRTLNHSTITPKELLNAETYYVSLIARELALTISPQQRAEVLAAHPRWEELCEEYGEPATIKEGDGEIDPKSLAARFVTVTFHLNTSTPPQEWTIPIPRSSNIYALLGRVSKRLGVSPLSLRLVWESGERDPVRTGGEGGEAPEEWDSSDEEEEGEGEWTTREVELVGGTRMVGSYLEVAEARVRVESV